MPHGRCCERRRREEQERRRGQRHAGHKADYETYGHRSTIAFIHVPMSPILMFPRNNGEALVCSQFVLRGTKSEEH